MMSILSGRYGRLSSFALCTLTLALAEARAQEPSSPQVHALPPVSVTANLVPTPWEAVGSAVTTLTGEELEKRQTRLVSDVLREVPGLAVNRTGPLGQLTQVRIRGAEGNHTLVLIDGIRVNDPSAGSEFDFAHLLAAEVERVEVLRGPQSALYGSDAIGGVINIVTRRGQGRPTLRLSLEGGSFDTLAGRASVSGGGERYDFIAGAAGLRTHGVSVADEKRGNPERDGYRNGTGFATLNLRPSDIFELSLVGRYVDFHSDSDTEIGGVGAIDADQDIKGDQIYGRIQGRLSLLEDRWEHILGLSHVRHQRDYREAGAVTSSYEGKTYRIDYQSNVYFETLSFLDAAHVATFAVQHEDNRAVSESQWSSFDRSIDTTGFIGQYQVTLLDRLTLTGSLRHDRNEIFKDADTFRLTGAYAIPQTGTKLRASYGTGVKNPTLFELFGYTNTYRGNPDLKPEKGTGWDAGIDQAFWNDRAVLDATYFNQTIEDLIQGTGQTSANLPGRSKIWGTELGLTLRLLENLTARGAYTYSSGEDATGAELVRRPSHIASLNLDYRFLEDRAKLNLGIVYNGKQKDWAFDALWNRRVVELDAYTLVNLAGSYAISGNAEIHARVENLFDEHYQEVFSYGTPGRAGYVGINLAF
ncbi:TonB-dependent siderophore receptor [Telmatospirillum sp. J64-1]|uniref:TonB-dependent receptor plug domain-containing protein n=1 Tax=Telmatospirillum sp. J64-1 TaxID=2502183 RepID=UPI002104EF4A|nr:TonB-dependent receptor [Telmatospirillum sp. J64-1]